MSTREKKEWRTPGGTVPGQRAISGTRVPASFIVRLPPWTRRSPSRLSRPTALPLSPVNSTRVFLSSPTSRILSRNLPTIASM